MCIRLHLLKKYCKLLSFIVSNVRILIIWIQNKCPENPGQNFEIKFWIFNLKIIFWIQLFTVKYQHMYNMYFLNLFFYPKFGTFFLVCNGNKVLLIFIFSFNEALTCNLFVKSYKKNLVEFVKLVPMYIQYFFRFFYFLQSLEISLQLNIEIRFLMEQSGVPWQFLKLL